MLVTGSLVRGDGSSGGPVGRGGVWGNGLGWAVSDGRTTRGDGNQGGERVGLSDGGSSRGNGGEDSDDGELHYNERLVVGRSVDDREEKERKGVRSPGFI